MRSLFITKPFVIPPLGIMYLIGMAKNQGFKSDIITTDEDIDAKIEDFRPDILCYSIMTGDQYFYDNINQRLKEKYCLYSIAGGPHPTFFPEMLDESSFDAICIGEGEYAFAHVVSYRDFGGPNIRFKQNRKPFPDMEPLVDLDELPFPDRSCVLKYNHIKNSPIKHFIAGRGCPYNCSYCFNQAYSKLYKGLGKRVRLRSVNDLIQEIKEVAFINSEMQFVYFQDDTFILDSKWLREFATKYDRVIHLPFHCHTRANLVTEQVVYDLKRAGCYSVHLAAETGDEEIRERLLNRKMTNREIKSAVDIFKNAGIKVMLQNILGLPGTTLANDLETLELNIWCQPDYAWASIFQPYPKTQLGEYSREIGEYTGDFSDISSSFFDVSPLKLDHKNEIANLQKLFAFAVQNPIIYNSGELQKLIKRPYKHVRELYTFVYKTLRKESDKVLYGFDL